MKSFPGAQTPSLQNAYEIHCNGDVVALATALQGSGLFSLVELEPYYQLAGGSGDCGTSCSNPLTVNDPGVRYELALTQAPCAWNITQGSPSVVVAVVDSYFDQSNPDLAGQFVSVTGTPGDPECNEHGTAVAGMIAALHNNNYGIAGLAPGAKVAGYIVPTSFNPLDNRCTGAPWPQVWQAYQDGRKIINASWSGMGATTPIGGGHVTVSSAITEMTQNGTLLVVAAGNGDPGQPTPHDIYADIPGVIMVSSVSDDGTLHEWVDYNQHVDICAPGNGVGCLGFGGFGYGTSLSAPCVAAAAALMLSVNSNLTPAEIEQILKCTACPIVNNPIPDWTGAGYLNIYQALVNANGAGAVAGSIAQNTTWDSPRLATGDIVVESFTTLTINNTVYFEQGTGLYIRPNAKVVLNGKLTAACESPFWDGVEVWGDPLRPQSPTAHGYNYQGKLEANAGAIIEKAKTAVRLGQGPTSGGGIIIANGLTLRNNELSIDYLPYGPVDSKKADYVGGLVNCTFVVDDEYPSELALEFTFIKMKQVFGVYALGCNFYNDRSYPTNIASVPDGFGYGVHAFDSRFILSPSVSTVNGPSRRCNFRNLGFGVFAKTITTNQPYIVKGGVFEDCIYGIRSNRVQGATIVSNTFTLGHLQENPVLGTPASNQQFGVYMEENTPGFILESNTFTDFYGSEDITTVGIYSNNLGISDNQIRLNQFFGLQFANIADKTNGKIDPLAGLKYLCNSNFSNRRFDFNVSSTGIIHKLQTERAAAPSNTIWFAGNLFSRPNNVDGDFANYGSAGQINYPTPSVPITDLRRPRYVRGVTVPPLNYQPNPCTPVFCEGECGGPEQLATFRSNYFDAKGRYLTALSEKEVAEAQSNAALAEEKEAEASDYHFLVSHAALQAAMLYGHDTTTLFNKDSLRVWWQRMDSPASDVLLAQDFLANNRLSDALATLNGTIARYNLDTEEIEDLADLKTIATYLQGKSLYGLDSADLAYLEPYTAREKGFCRAWSQGILSLYGFHYTPVSMFDESPEERPASETSENNTSRPAWQIMPNPATTEVRFVGPTQAFASTVHISVVDTSGKIVWEHFSPDSYNKTAVWNLNGFVSGLYFYQIRTENNPPIVGKIILRWASFNLVPSDTADARVIGDSILYAMKNTSTLALLFAAAAAFAQPGFNRKYNSNVFWETYFNVLYHDGHLTAPGCVTYDTLNWGFTHTELDTNGNLMSSRYLPVNLPEYVENWYGSPIIKLRNGNVMSATGIHVPGGKGYLLAIHDGEELKTAKEYVNLETFFLLVTGLCETDNAVYLSTVRQKNNYKNTPIVQRLDKNGGIVWSKEYTVCNYDNTVNSIYPIDNNTIVLAGAAGNGGWVPPSSAFGNSFMMAIDSMGNVKWQWESDNLQESDITGLKRLPDGGWLYATNRFDPYSIFTGWVNHNMIIRRDSNLNLVWKKQINSTQYAYVCDLELTPDGNCVAATTWSYPPPSPDFLTTAIYKLSLDGEVLWARDPVYLYDENPVEHVFGGVEVLPSGSIAAAGWITRYNEGAKTYGWLVKISPDGCIYDDDPCIWWPGVIGGIGTDEAAPVEKMRVFPNPATDFVHIELPGGLREPIVQVFDWQGREALRQPADGTLARARLDVAGLAAGLYVVAVSEKGRVLAREKLVVAK